MNKQTISLGRLFGIPIRLHYSWFLIFALLTWSLATSYYPYELTRQPAALYWVMGAGTAVILFGSVLLHELGHSLVALRFKIPVRRITLFIFGGVAEIGREPPSPSSEFLIAIAGPSVSFGLAALFAVLQAAAGAWAPLFLIAKYLAFINGSLALFNMIPGFPLDGGRVLRSIVWGATHNLRLATKVAANLGKLVGFIFIAIGVWQVFTGDLGGLWFAFIGWYLQNAADSQMQQQTVADQLAGHPVSEAMSRSYVLIPGDMTLRHLVDQNLLGFWQRAFVLQNDGDIAGLLTWRDVNAIPSEHWPTTTVAQAMIPLSHLQSIAPEAQLETVAAELARHGAASLPVVANGQVLGTIGREELSWFLRRPKTLQA